MAVGVRCLGPEVGLFIEVEVEMIIAGVEIETGVGIEPAPALLPM